MRNYFFIFCFLISELEVFDSMGIGHPLT